MALPIFIVHNRYSDYLKYCLHQAKHYNPKSEIILIGDRRNNKYNFVHHYHASGYSFNAKHFSKVYSQTNSNAPAARLRRCFKRWFVLRDFMRKHDFGDEFVYIESDVLLYCDVTKESDKFKGNKITFGYQGAPHVIFFSSVQALEDLCDLIQDMYSKREQAEITSREEESGKIINIPGDIDIMNLISEYRKEFAGLTGDNSVVINGTTYDSSINEVQDYEVDAKHHLKRIYWKDGYPHGKFLPDGNLIRFNALHFPGASRLIMHRYYSGEKLRFKKIVSEVRNSLFFPFKKSKLLASVFFGFFFL